MRIGVVGLGRLGLPVAVAMGLRGHTVLGHDTNPARANRSPKPEREAGPSGVGEFNSWLRESRIGFGSLQEVAAHAEIIFVAVQTPHEPKFEGISPLPDERADFRYDHLRRVISDLAQICKRPTVVAVISTVLPGTMRREILGLANPFMRMAYTPSFIAMGTTMRDFLDPEFFLVGTDDRGTGDILEDFFDSIAPAPIKRMTIESAELAKVAYNTFVSAKIAIINSLMEICDKIPNADIDQVSNALMSANRRITGPAYMQGGMGDGGGCHPRDNIAMSWLARELNLSFDLFDPIMRAREEQARMLARELISVNLPPAIYGIAYKPETDLILGSHALLVANILRDELGQKPIIHDPHVPGTAEPVETPHVILIGCRHEAFWSYRFPQGSVVIDPFRYILDQPGVVVHRIGEARPPDMSAEAIMDRIVQDNAESLARLARS